jgi:hypothetical protein
LNSRAPSRKLATPARRAAAQIASASACGNTRPPPRLCVFSTSTSVVAGKMEWPGGLKAAAKSAAVNKPPLPTGVNCTPALAPLAPASCQTAWLSWLTITSSPGRVNSLSAT